VHGLSDSLSAFNSPAFVLLRLRSRLQVQFNIFCWSSDLKYEPTDEDHKIAKDKTLAVEDTGKLAIIWVDLKR
jgi:hypothetical protein